MQGDDEMTVAELATTRPASIRVLYRHGIEFCAGASRRLNDACREVAIDVEAVLAEVDREETGAGAGVVWATRPVAELVDHLVHAFHTVEQRELADLQDALRAAAGRQPGSAALDDLADAIVHLRTDLCEHMAKEETVLFPWLRSGRGDLARTPIQVMMMEHDATLRLLNQVRALRQAWVAPAAAEIVERLTALDRHIREHMHLENNVLFPRALRGEE